MDNASNITTITTAFTNQIIIESDVNGFVVDESKISAICRRLLGNLGLKGAELSVQFVAPPTIRHLNQTFRGMEKSTDVLSFPQMEFPQKVLCAGVDGKSQRDFSRQDENYFEPLGDIVISVCDADRNATSIGHGVDREVAFLLIHGLLHLLGHDHMNPDEEKIMCDEQQKLLTMLEHKDLSSVSGEPVWVNCVHKTKN